MSADEIPAAYDGRRGAAALILAVADGRTADVDVILGCNPYPYDDRVARIAFIGRAREQEARQ